MEKITEAKRRATLRIKELVYETNECINGFPLNKDGYVLYQYYQNKDKVRILGHRLSYEIFNNVEIDKDAIICHTCDNPSCINPKHLFLGTHVINVEDKVKKGRQAKGSKNGRYTTGYYSKYEPVEKPKKPFDLMYGRGLSIDKVVEFKKAIRDRGNKTLKELSKELGISYCSLRDISCGRTYSKVVI